MSKRLMRNYVAEEKTLEEVFEEFQLKNKIKNLAPMTIRYYDENLNRFFEFTSKLKIRFPTEISEKIIDKYVLFLKYERKVSPSSINIYLRAVRAFLYFAMQNQYLDHFKIQLLKIDINQKVPHTSDEISKLIKRPDIRKCGFIEHRNWVAVCYLLETGNRLNTVINIQVGDVDLDGGMVKMNVNKNRKTQYNPLSQNLIVILREYIRAYRLTDEDYLFISEFRTQFSRQGFYKAIVSYCKNRGVDKSGLHIFRHSFAKNYLITNGNISKLQRLMGHTNINVTMGYVNLYATDLKEDFDDHSIIVQFSKNKRMERKSKKDIVARN